MRRLVVLTGSTKGSVLDLEGDRLAVGREDDNNIALPDTNVSRHHAILIRKGADYVLKDLGSANGTFVNDQPALETPLQPGDKIRFGFIESRYESFTPPSKIVSDVTSSPLPGPKEAEVEELRRKLSVAEQQLVREREQNATRLASERQRAAKLVERFRSTGQVPLRELAGKVADFQKDDEFRRQELARVQTELQHCQQKFTTTEKEIQELTARVEEHQKSVADYEKLRTNFVKLQTLANSQRKELARLRTRNRELNEAETAGKVRVAEMEQLVARRESAALKRAAEEVAELRADLQRVTAELALARTDLKRLLDASSSEPPKSE